MTESKAGKETAQPTATPFYHRIYPLIDVARGQTDRERFIAGALKSATTEDRFADKTLEAQLQIALNTFVSMGRHVAKKDIDEAMRKLLDEQSEISSLSPFQTLEPWYVTMRAKCQGTVDIKADYMSETQRAQAKRFLQAMDIMGSPVVRAIMDPKRRKI